MARLFWGSRDLRGQAPVDFDRERFLDLLERLSSLSGSALEFQAEAEPGRGAGTFCAIRAGGRRTGWGVRADGADRAARAACEAAAEAVSRLMTAEQDIDSLAMELNDRYEELNFLYEMGERVGVLLEEGEICAFVVEEAAWLMDCERASIMVPDPETGALRIRAAVGLPEEISDDVTVMPGERISGKVFESGREVIVNEGDPMPAESLNVRELRESRSFLSVPLKVSAEGGEGHDRILGVLNLTRKRGGSMFTASDLKLMRAVAATTATQIHNCRLINAERERQQLEHELELAARIQLGLLPKEPLRAGPVEVAGHCKPARHVGGDLFDYWLHGNRLSLVVADVSGHDLGAALMAASFRSVIRGEAVHRQSVAELVESVNRALFDDLARSELFVSAFYAEVELDSGTATFCRAGHPKPLLIQLGQKGWLDTEGLLLGIDQEVPFEQKSVQLDRGDTIVLYTDGLIEAQDPEHNAFGTDGVRRAALDAMPQAPLQMAEQVIRAAREHCASGPLRDDMTVMVVRFGSLRET